MANIKDTLNAVLQIDGSVATALVDWKSGMTLGTAGTSQTIELAAAGNTNVVRAKLNVMQDLKIKGGIEDILITLAEEYHLIRMIENKPQFFLYVVLIRDKANLGLARYRLSELTAQLEI